MNERTTHVYKRVDGCDIRADVFGARPGARKPAVIWIHGGGLIFGTRTSPRPAFLQAALGAGAVVVSIDHRMAPETKLPEIVQDLRDAWRWVRERGPELLGVDPARVGAAGTSSGAYLALMSGHCVEPRPGALASLWGFGDITTPWETEPSPYYQGWAPISRDEALATVGTSAISEPPLEPDRGYFYVYCRQQGLWPQEVAGQDPRRDPRWFDPYCPIRQVDAAYPPTILVHGTEDADVPHEESRAMAARLAEAGVEHEWVSVEGAGHGLSHADPARVQAIEARAAAFVVAHLR